MWPKLAKRFGCRIPRNQFKVDVDKDADSVMMLAEKPPISEVATQMGLEGNLRRNKVEPKINLMKWSQRKDVQEVWANLEKELGSEKCAFEKAMWGFLGFVLGRDYNVIISMR